MKTIILLLSLSISSAAFGIDGTVAFTLHNSSLKSIPLKISGVMNPNLSPNSDSSVKLETGQAIYFKYHSKKYLLLEVASKLDGTLVDVAQLIKERIEYLGLKESRKGCLFGKK